MPKKKLLCKLSIAGRTVCVYEQDELEDNCLGESFILSKGNIKLSRTAIRTKKQRALVTLHELAHHCFAALTRVAGRSEEKRADLLADIFYDNWSKLDKIVRGKRKTRRKK